LISADYKIQQRFHYETGKKFYAPLALSYFAPGVIMGTICKGVAFISTEVRERHIQIEKVMHPNRIFSCNETYQKWGMEINDWTHGDHPHI
jgi:hypothetical protein